MNDPTNVPLVSGISFRMTQMDVDGWIDVNRCDSMADARVEEDERTM
jgi:hypothetical protein